jgi:hypothetical protein
MESRATSGVFLLRLYLLVILGWIVFPPMSHGNPLDDYVSLWAGDGDATDSQDDNNGVEMGNVTYEGGIADQAFSLDGTSSYIEVAHNANLMDTDTLTLAAWIQTNDLSKTQWIVNKHRCTASQFGYNLALQYIDDGLHLSGSVPEPGGAGQPCGDRYGYAYAVDPSITDTCFHHVAMVYQGGSGATITLYVDGQEVPSYLPGGPIPPVANENLQPFRIGVYRNQPGSFSSHFNGRIDEVRMYDRALSSVEISQIGGPPVCDVPVTSKWSMVVLASLMLGAGALSTVYRRYATSPR